MPLVNGQMQSPPAHHLGRVRLLSSSSSALWGGSCTPRPGSYLWVGLCHTVGRSFVCLFDKNHRRVNSLMIYDFCIPSRWWRWPHPRFLGKRKQQGNDGPHIIFAICLQLCRLLSSDTLIIDTGVSSQTDNSQPLDFPAVYCGHTATQGLLGKYFKTKTLWILHFVDGMCLMRKWGKLNWETGGRESRALL